MGTVGELREISGEFAVEWRIEEFFSIPAEVDTFYKGPVFSFAGAYWRLRIFPNGRTKDTVDEIINSERNISLYLSRASSGPPINLEYSLGLKTLEGKVNPERHLTYNFTKIQGRGFYRLISRSELLEKKSELLPSGVLTVVCKIKYPKTADISSHTASEKCSYCKSILDDHEDLSSHQQKCMEKPIKCPECSDVVALKDWYDHKCQKTEAEAFKKLSHDIGTTMLSGYHSDMVVKEKEEECVLRSILAA